MNSTIRPLDTVTARRLHTGQVLLGIDAIVKELVENSIDAGAYNIEIKLVNNGLSTVQVKDDGHGIPHKDRAVFALQHYTSKITSFEDLEKLFTLGFRGEALNAICCVAEKFELVTKTNEDAIAKSIQVDNAGAVFSERPSGAISRSGVIATVYNPFAHIPVRRQMCQKTTVATVKKIQDLLIRYALAWPAIRFSLTQTSDSAGSRKETRWVKPACPDIVDAVASLFGNQIADMVRFHRITSHNDKNGTAPLSIESILPLENSDPSVVYRGDRLFIHVNRRPIQYTKSDLKDIVTLLRRRYRRAVGLLDEFSKKIPFAYINICIDPSQYDVNVEPTKAAVLFQNPRQIVDLFEELMDQTYGSETQDFFGLSKTTSAQMPASSDSAQKDNEEVRGTSATSSIQQLGEEGMGAHRKDIAESIQIRDDDDEQQLNASANESHTPGYRGSIADTVLGNHEQRPSASGDDDRRSALQREEEPVDELEEDDDVWEFSMFKQSLEESDEEIGSLVSQLEPTSSGEGSETHQVPTLTDWLQQANVQREDETSVVPASTASAQKTMTERLGGSNVSNQQSDDIPTESSLPRRAESESIDRYVENDMGWQVESLSAAAAPARHQEDIPSSSQVRTTPRVGEDAISNPPVEHHEPATSRSVTSSRSPDPQDRRRSSNSNYFANWLNEQNRKRQSAYTRPAVAKKRVCILAKSAVEERRETDGHDEAIRYTVMPPEAPHAIGSSAAAVSDSSAAATSSPATSASRDPNDANATIHKNRASRSLFMLSKKPGTLFPHLERNHHTGQLSRTLNQEIKVQCGWNDLQKRSETRQYRLSRFYRTLLDRYPNPDHALKTCLVYPWPYDKKDLAIYTRVSSAAKAGNFLQQAIILDLYSLRLARLLEEYEVECDQTFDPPVEITLDISYAPVFESMHNKRQKNFNEIQDRRIHANGLRARWYCTSSAGIKIQVTSASSLLNVSADIQELLSCWKRAEQPRVASIRPERVVAYLKTLAHEDSISDADEAYIDKTLPALLWKDSIGYTSNLQRVAIRVNE